MIGRPQGHDIIHDIIDSQRIDVLVPMETWMSADQPAAIARDVTPSAYSFAHRFRDGRRGWWCTVSPLFTAKN